MRHKITSNRMTLVGLLPKNKHKILPFASDTHINLL